MIKQLNEKYFQRYAMIEQWNLDITKGPKDRQNVVAIPTARFRLGSFSFIYFAITGVKEIVRFTEDFVI